MIKIPQIGLTYSRNLLPQLGPTKAFLENLDKHNIKYKSVVINPSKLKSSQSEFDIKSIKSIMDNPSPTKSSIIISNDDYVLDGHHRWIAAHNKKEMINVIRVDLPILELIRITKDFDTSTFKTIKNVKITNTIKTVINEIIENRKYK